MAMEQKKLKIARRLAQARVFTYLSSDISTFNSGFAAGLEEAARIVGGIDVYAIENDALAWAHDNCPGLGNACVLGCHACSEWAKEYEPEIA